MEVSVILQMTIVFGIIFGMVLPLFLDETGKAGTIIGSGLMLVGVTSIVYGMMYNFASSTQITNVFSEMDVVPPDRLGILFIFIGLVVSILGIIIFSFGRSKTQKQYSNNGNDAIGQIERLVKLKESGVISEEEFLEQKGRMLSK